MCIARCGCRHVYRHRVECLWHVRRLHIASMLHAHACSIDVICMQHRCCMYVALSRRCCRHARKASHAMGRVVAVEPSAALPNKTSAMAYRHMRGHVPQPSVGPCRAHQVKALTKARQKSTGGRSVHMRNTCRRRCRRGGCITAPRRAVAAKSRL